MNNIEIKWQRNYYAPTIDLKISAHRRDLIPFLRNAATERITGISYPRKIFSDGTYIWVLGATNIYRIDPQTNGIDYSYIGGTTRFAYDGKRIWVTQHSSKRIIIIDKNTLLTEDIIDTTPNRPVDIVFVGDSMWVSTRNPYELRVYHLNLNLRHTTEGLATDVLAFDGKYIYASDHSSSKIIKIRTYSRTIEAEIDVYGTNLVCNRGNLYLTYFGGSKLGHINPETNTIEEDLDISPDRIFTFCFDINGYIWLTTYFTKALFKYAHRPLETTPRMQLIEQFGIGGRCYGLTFDGTHIWATTFYNHTVYKIPAFDLSFHWSPPY